MNPDIQVFRNDAITIDQIREKKPSHIIISPGPGFPKDAGISIELVKKLGSDFPILGVCLGHQAIGEAYGGKVIHANELMHGKTSDVTVSPECPLFAGLSARVLAGRYHSLIVEKQGLPDCFAITAETATGEIMGLMHKKYPVFGIQFHPESILTPEGKTILKNFLSIRKA